MNSTLVSMEELEAEEVNNNDDHEYVCQSGPYDCIGASGGAFVESPGQFCEVCKVKPFKMILFRLTVIKGEGRA